MSEPTYPLPRPDDDPRFTVGMVADIAPGGPPMNKTFLMLLLIAVGWVLIAVSFPVEGLPGAGLALAGIAALWASVRVARRSVR